MSGESRVTTTTPGSAATGQAPPGERSPLLRPDWSYIEKSDFYAFTREDMGLMRRQHDEFDAERRGEVVLALLKAGEHEPTYGYQINNFRHSLQSATLVRRAGHSDEDVVVALLHDVGFLACPERHGAFSAELLGGYISDRNYWMLRHHQAFAAFEPADEAPPAEGSRAWERWRGHDHFDWTYEFVRAFDINAMRPDFVSDPLESFAPLVQVLFSQPARPLVLDD
jgi:hypothetical protein